MNFTPLYDRILVKRLAEEEVTKSGLVIPDTAKEKPIRGEVVAVGAGRRQKDGSTRPPAIATGARVLFEKWAGSEIKLDGEDHLILKEDEVLGLLEE